MLLAALPPCSPWGGWEGGEDTEGLGRSMKAETLHEPAGCALSLELSDVAALGEGAKEMGHAWPGPSGLAWVRPPREGVSARGLTRGPNSRLCSGRESELLGTE